MKLGIDVDDVTAVCAVPYLRKFAEHFGVPLPDEEQIGWHLLDDSPVKPRSRQRGTGKGTVQSTVPMPSTIWVSPRRTLE